MAGFLQLALLVVAGIALAFPLNLVSANPMDAAPEDDQPTDVSKTLTYEGSSMRVMLGDGPSARAYCGGFSPGQCSALCGSLGWPYYQCTIDSCRCSR